MRPLLGTFVEIALNESGPGAESDVEAAFEAIARVHRLMNAHDPMSELSRLNAAPIGNWLDVDPWTARVLEAAASLEHLSDGIFSAAPLPGAFEVDRASTRARRLLALSVDLGGIAKGFAVDEAVRTVSRRTSPSRASGIVNAGGDIRVFGEASFELHLRAETDFGPVVRPYRCAETAVATSSAWPRAGSGRDPRAASHRRYGHAFEARRTVTVFAPECLWADALAKVALLADPNEHAALLARCLKSAGARALLFDENGAAREAA